MERILAEEARYGVAYVIFHHEDNDRKTEEQEQRHLAEICLHLLCDSGAVAVPFGPVTELCLSPGRELEEDHRDSQENEELNAVQLLEECYKILFVACENKSREECGCRVDPPFAVEPQGFFYLPPLSFGSRRRKPPVVFSVPPCEMSVVAEADAQSDDEEEHDAKTYGAALDEAEAKKECEIKESEDYREPCVFVHHGKAQSVEDPALLRELEACEIHEQSVDQHVYVERYYDGLYDPVPDEALKVVLLCVEALDKSVTGAEKEDRNEVRACINERRENMILLEYLLLRNVVENDTDRCKAAQRFHRVKACKIIIEFVLFSELVGPSPDEKDQIEKENDLCKYRAYSQVF